MAASRQTLTTEIQPVPTPPPKVFVSSTWLDLQPEREAVEAALRRMRTPDFVGMEYFGSRDETPRDVSLAEVDRSDVYVGIFAGRYGSGITEAEYRRARERNLPCFIYFKAESAITLDKYEQKQRPRARLNKLKAELHKAHTVSEFTTPEDLATKVTADLHAWALNEYHPRTRPTSESAPTLSALHQLPAPPRDFTGRGAELDELLRGIDQGGVSISGLQGQGGIGKTALALVLAHRIKPRYPDAQFFLDLKGTTAPLSATDAMAHVIRSYEPTAKLPEDENSLRALYNSVLDGKRALLLMDNARDAAQIEPLVPPEGCVLLVTSRWHFTLPGLFSKDLDTLSPEEAHNLLRRIAPRVGDHAEEIARLCGHLPLALRLAASALVERPDLTPADLARRLKDEGQRLKVLGAVEASIAVSYELLPPERQKQWRALGVFPGTFDLEAAAAVLELERDAAQDALGELVNYSLLEFDETEARYSLHDLARLSARKRLSNEERHAAELRHSAHYLAMFRRANSLYKQGGDALMRGLALFDEEQTNIRAGQAWAAQHADEETAARLCSMYPIAGAYFLNLRLHPREQINWLEQALSAARKTKDRYIEGSALGNLGVAYKNLGEPRRAVEFFEQALEIDREIGDRRGEGADLGNLGIAYKNLGETRRAVEFHEQALEIDREIGDRRGEGADLGNLGIAYAALGETRRAVEFFEQALEIDREIGDRRGEGVALWNLSLALDALSDRDQAIAYAEAALKIFEQIEDPNAAKVRKKLAEWRGQTR